MLVLGIQGSPRKQGNSNILLTAFLKEAKRLGAQTYSLSITNKKIQPCRGCGTCLRQGFCALKDDMQKIYPLLWKADVIVVATPIFFYSVPAQLKALIDRCQTLWARKYVLKIADPGHQWRKGFMLSVGATKGENLFAGAILTMRYFFDAVGARYEGSLTYRNVENPRDITKHPAALKDVKKKVSLLVKPFLKRKNILFVCKENSCRSQMAQAFTRYYAGDKIEAESAGTEPAKKINDLMVKAMEEKGIDMAFRRPQSTFDLPRFFTPHLVISMGCEKECSFSPHVPFQDWNLPNPARKPINVMRAIRDEIEKRVKTLLNAL